MIIELIGIPGSGKSTYLELIRNEIVFDNNLIKYKIVTSKDIDRHYKQIIKKHFLLKFNILIKLFNFYVLFELLRILLLKVSFKEKTHLSLYLLNIHKRYVIYSKYLDSKKTIFLVDEGLLQVSCAISSLLKEGQSNKNVNKVFQHLFHKYHLLYERTLIIFINTQIENSFVRIEKRIQGWPKYWKQLDNDSKRSRLNNFGVIIAKSIPIIKTRTNKLFIINNDENVLQFIDDVFFKISELLNFWRKYD